MQQYRVYSELLVCEHGTLVTTELGSCISVTMFHPESRIGAICHALLPRENMKGEAFRYVDTSILKMLERFTGYGISRDSYVDGASNFAAEDRSEISGTVIHSI